MVTGLDWNMLRKYKCVSEMVVWMVHVELYDNAADDSDNRSGEEEQPGYQLLKTLSFCYKLDKLLFWLNEPSLCVHVFERVQCGRSDSLCNVE